MSEWWTYAPSDFLMFAPRTYHRLFELYNADVWPAQWLGVALGVGLLVLLLRGSAAASRVALGVLAACWLWVVWAFHLERYSTINTAAPWFAAAFALQGLLLAAIGAFGPALRVYPEPGLRRIAGITLLAFAALAHPLLGWLLGRPWAQAEVFAFAPDPTVLGTLGVLLLLSGARRERGGTARQAWLLWPLPILWCFVSGMTLWTMHAPDALVLPGAALLALVALRARPLNGRR